MWRFRILAVGAVAALIAIASPSFADDGCGTKVKPEHVPLVQARIAAGAYTLEGGVAGTSTIPLTIHVVRRDDQSGGIGQTRIDRAIADANALWSPHQIEFCQVGVTRYIDDSTLYSGINTSAEIETLRGMNAVPNTINVYCTEYLSDEEGGLCGTSSFTFSDTQGIVMKNSCFGTVWNPSTFAHELGHYFDLFHTHETAFGEECTDGDNCAEAGDLLCDTPADPTLNQDGLVSFCVYVGSVEGPCFNDPDYDPDPTNIMSYAPKGCRTLFTPGQEGRANATLFNLRPELLTYGDCSFSGICGGDSGNCFTANGSPGCEYDECCATVCAADFYCCDTEWDSLCASEALELCAGCGVPEAGNCYTDTDSPGCRTEACCELVCDVDPYCCAVQWDGLCASRAFDLCSECGQPGTGPCDMIHLSPSCDDAACCEAVCAIDPACCELGWSAVCVGLAIDLGCGSPGAGDECPTCHAVGEGSVTGVTLSDNTGASGDDSSCATGDTVDEWYCYTPTCTGTATASICTEFSTVDIVLTAFDACGGTELACSSTHLDCSFGIDDNAHMTWPVQAGVTTYVRVSAVGATPTQNFLGDLLIECGTGCGTVGTGNCFADNGAGSPYCEIFECCAMICAADPFCCDMWWDQACADDALELCTSCGDEEAGGCLDPNFIAGCDDAGCCAKVCEIDPFCCAVGWDSQCVGEAETLCAMTFSAGPHLPLGDATLTLGGGGTLVVSGIGSSGEDGVEAGYGDAHGVAMGVILPTASSLPTGAALRMETRASADGGPDATIAALVAADVGAAYRLSAAYPLTAAETYHLRVYNGNTIVYSALNVSGPAVDVAAAPQGVEAKLVDERDVSVSCTWNVPRLLTPFGAPAVLGTRVTMISEVGAAPDDPDGPAPVRRLTRSRLLGTSLGSFTITGETLTGCVGDTNADVDVDVNDLVNIITTWGTASPGADVNDDGEVDVDDLNAVIIHWGPC